MKNLLSKILMLLAIFYMFSCVNEPSYYVVTGIVRDSVNDQISEFVVGAPVTINQVTVLTDSTGKFVFDRVPEGIHIIHVSRHFVYGEYSIETRIFSSTDVEIYLQRIKEDYFPIEVNTQMKFIYHSYHSSGAGFEDYLGESIWDVYTLELEDGTHVYQVKETISTMYTTLYTEPEAKLQERSFEIREVESHKIRITSASVSGIVFDRYFDPRDGEIIGISNGQDQYIAVKNNVGLYRIYRRIHRWYEEYDLIE